MSTSFQSYLNEIARYPLLSSWTKRSSSADVSPRCVSCSRLERTLTDAEQRLVRSGQRARERFMQCNLQLVVHVAKKYENRRRKSLEIMDLIQEGNIGLARAVELFDSSRGYKFSTYAYWWIKQGIQRALSQSDAMIRLPTGLHDLLAKIARTTSDLGQQMSRTPTLIEIAEHIGVDVNVIHDALRRSHAVNSLDAISANSETLSLIDMIADPKSLIDMNELSISHQAEEMLELIDKYLDDRSKFVVRSRRLQEPLCWDEIGAKLGISRARAQQLERMALFRLKMMLNKGRELHGTPLGKLQPLNRLVICGECALMGSAENTSKNGKREYSGIKP
jgi:RNA polymerase primary sigma factor